MVSPHPHGASAHRAPPGVPQYLQSTLTFHTSSFQCQDTGSCTVGNASDVCSRSALLQHSGSVGAPYWLLTHPHTESSHWFSYTSNYVTPSHPAVVSGCSCLAGAAGGAARVGASRLGVCAYARQPLWRELGVPPATRKRRVSSAQDISIIHMVLMRLFLGELTWRSYVQGPAPAVFKHRRRRKHAYTRWCILLRRVSYMVPAGRHTHTHIQPVVAPAALYRAHGVARRRRW
jgi:hypothetical protein